LSIALLLDMAVSSNPDRLAVVSNEVRLTTGELSELAEGGAGVIAASGAQHVAYVGTGGVMLPLLIFSSARSGLAFTPINYRLSTEGIRSLIERLPDPLVVVDDRYREMVGDAGTVVMGSEEFLAAARIADPVGEFPDPDAVAIVLFTSGTTSKPKAVELSHNNLTSYVTGTVEFESADPTDAALICVPPYHIAGVGAALSNLYAGRKMVYLPNFDAQEWVRLVNDEGVSTATVVPTMLDRIVAVLEGGGHDLPTLRNLAYGGSKVGAAPGPQGAGAVAECRLRQRLRADRDQLHHRGADPRRPPAAPMVPTIRRSPSGCDRWASPCRVSRCRSATTTARCWGLEKPAS